MYGSAEPNSSVSASKMRVVKMRWVSVGAESSSAEDVLRDRRPPERCKAPSMRRLSISLEIRVTEILNPWTEPGEDDGMSCRTEPSRRANRWM